MADSTTDSGGSTSSFSNTPQAKDDYYNYLEDLLRNDATLYNVATNTVTLDVMKNDLGGNAKTLFSVEDGDGNAITSDYELLAKDVGASGCSAWELTYGGNWVRINNGKIEYRIADGSGIPGQGRSIDSLTLGQDFNDQFVYAIRLGNGTLSEATVKIHITGAQDAATIAVQGASDNSVTEAGGVANTLPGDPSAGGTLVVNDLDFGENKFQTPPSGSLNGTYGTFTFNPNSGVWTYTLDNGRPATQALAAGQSTTETLTVTSFDGSASYNIVVNVHGTNDAPVAVADTGGAGENQTILVDVLANDTDVDAGHSFTLVSASAPAGQGTASIVGGQVQFNPGTDFDHLAQGATASVTVNYTMQDEHGATSSSTLTITVTGTNDGPVAHADVGAGTENQTILVDVLANDTDVDDGHTLSLVSASAPAGQGTASIVGGQVQFDPGTDFDHLAQGATASVIVNYTMQDEHGATSSSTLTITVTGTNDTPVASPASNSLFEDASVSGNVGATDADDGAVLSYALTGAPPAGLTFNSDGSYSFDASSYDGLAQGETQILTIPFTATDEHLATSVPANLTITITGTNDAPTVTDVSVLTPVEDGPAVGGSFSGDDVDSDDSGASLTYSIITSPAEGSVVNNNDGTFSFDPGADFQDLAEGETRQVSFTYNATDSHGAVSNTGTVTVTVTGTNDDPEISIVGTDDADATIAESNIGLLASGTLTVTDADTSNVVDTAVTGVTLGGDFGSLTEGAVAGMLTLSGDVDLAANAGDANNLGWAFDSGSEAFDFLAAGQSLTLTYHLVSTDDEGATDAQDVTITVTGTNDDPVLSATLTNATFTDTANDDSFSAVSGTLSTVDPDSGDTAAYSVSGGVPDVSESGFDTSSASAYGTLYLNSSTGAYKFVPNDTAIEALKGDDSVNFTLTVTDGQGATDSDTLTITLNGVNDTPELGAVTDASYNDTASDDSFANVTGTLTSTDRDSPETATYSVAGQVPSVEPGFNQQVAGTYGTLYLNSSTGAYKFVPNDAAIEGLKTTDQVDFAVTVTDGSGATDSDTLTITLNGVNDTPEAPPTNSVTTDEDLASSAVAIGASDRDAGEVLTYSVKTGEEPAKGSVSFDQTNGTFTYTPDPDENGSDSFTILITDADGATTEQVVSVTVNPVNDAPTLAPVASGSIAEVDQSASTNSSNLSGTLVGADVDGDTLTYGIQGVTPVGSVATLVTAYGVLTVNTGTGAYLFTPDPAAIEALDVGENPALNFTMTVSDGVAPDVTQLYTINLTGADDAPTLQAVTSGSIAELDQSSSVTSSGLSGTLVGADVDVETLTYGIVGGTVSAGVSTLVNAYGTLTVNTTTGAYNFAPNAVTIEALDVGENPSVNFTVTVSDGDGPTVNQTYTINLTGADDAPTLAPVTAGSISEADQSSSTTSSGLSGTLVGADVDVETLTYGIVGGTVSAGVSTLVNAYGTLTVDTATGAYLFTPNAAIEGLDVGENPSLNFTMTVSDGDGPTVNQTYTINLTGADDAPTLQAVTSGSIAEIDQSSSVTSSGLSGTLVGADVDVETLTYGIVGGTVSAGVSTLVNTYGTLTVNTSTGAYSFTPNAASIEGLDVGENPSVNFTMTVSDGDGPTVNQTYTINLTGADDAPTLQAVTSGSVAEVPNSTSTTDSGLTGTLVGADVDVETLTYGIVGGTVSAGFSTLIGTYGTLSVNTSTGAYTYTKNAAAIEALNTGQNPSDSFTVSVTDGDGALVTQTYTVNLTGANDASVAVNDKLVISSNTTATFSTSVLTANDSTQLQVVSMAIVGTPQGTLTFNATTQTFVYSSTGGTGAAVDTLSYTLSDGSTATVTLDVLNANSSTFNLTTESGGIYAAAGSYQGSYLDFASGNDTGTGSVAPDTLLGGAGGDTLNGGSGGDILRGGAGNDNLNGQGDPGQFDLIDLSDAAAAIAGVNAFTLGAGGNGSYTSSAAVGLGTDTYTGMEGVIGSAFADTLTGNGDANEIRGGGGNDTISGLGGNDILKGDAGNDTMTGGAGNDIFVLGPAGVDTITDYSNIAGNADVIDVTEYLSVAAGTDVVGGQYVRVTTTGLVQVDADGGGTWVTVANVNVGAASYTLSYYSGGVLTNVSVTPSGPPIALDMDGDGQISFLATDAGASFDYGYGRVGTAWVAGNDGILVRDANHDGQASANEVVFATSGSDLQGLAVYDSNHDGQLSSADAGFADFQVWQDANSNGTVEAGEMHSLTALGIASISLTSDGVGYSAAGGDVQVVGTGSYTRADGSTGVLADAVFETGKAAGQVEKQALVSANSNAVLLSAVAAAGFIAAEPLAAAGHFSVAAAGSVDLGSAAHSQALAPVALDTLGTAIAHDSFAQSVAMHSLVEAQSSVLHAPTYGETRAVLDNGFAHAPTELLQAAPTPMHNQVASQTPLAAQSVAMPSGAQLAALAGSGAPEGVQHNAIVSQVLADALHGGDTHAVAIDALLSALPGSGTSPGNMPSDALANHFAASLGHLDFGAHGLFGADSAVSVTLAHPDAIAPA